MANFDPIIERTFDKEGGFQQYADDKANYSCNVLVGTQNGISATALQAYYGRCVTIADIKGVTKSLAKEIYKKNFWNPISGDKIKNQSVGALLFAQYIGSPSRCKAYTLEALKELGMKITSISTPYSTDVINFINKKPKQFHKLVWDKKYDYLINHPSIDKYSGWLTGHKELVYHENPLVTPEMAGVGVAVISVAALYISTNGFTDIPELPDLGI